MLPVLVQQTFMMFSFYYNVHVLLHFMRCVQVSVRLELPQSSVNAILGHSCQSCHLCFGDKVCKITPGETPSVAWHLSGNCSPRENKLFTWEGRWMVTDCQVERWLRTSATSKVPKILLKNRRYLFGAKVRLFKNLLTQEMLLVFHA